MVDLGTDMCKYFNTGKFTSQGSFTNSYANEIYESKHVRKSTKQLPVTLDAK